MKLIITRHGETEENIAGILQGHLPGKLSTKGIEQAKKVALRLKNENIDFIYSSDLARAADTAKEIAKHHSGASIAFVKNLRERNFGEFQGKKKSDFGWNAKDQKVIFIEPKEGETMKAVYERAENFLHKIIHKHHDDSVLFVCHAGVGKAMVAVITGKKHSEIKNIEDMQNTSVSTFEIDEDKNHKIICYNCVKHLK
ncbi:histidine phosphatase family protein [Candidatus Parcubacteria bacterium]|nr:histidine phosphatase family protein [Candidatus Parcubacteria bacterium]